MMHDVKRVSHFVRIVSLHAALAAVAACSPPYEDPYPTAENAGIVIGEDLGREYTCEPWCARPYRELTSRWPEAARPVDARALKRRLREIADEAVPESLGLSHVEIGERIARDLNLTFMLEGLERRTLEVVTVAREEADGYTREKLLLRDPVVGTFEALLLRPVAGHHGAGIVGLHGHFDDASAFERKYLGGELARAGFVVLIPTFRVMAFGEENDVTEELLDDGFHLMSIRVYEALRAVQLMRHLLATEGACVGVLSHSGGSSTARLLVRVTDSVDAVVVDWSVEYRGASGLHCEMVPDLFDYHLEINDLATLPVPYLEVPYEFEDPADRARILEFFVEALRPGEPVAG